MKWACVISLAVACTATTTNAVGRYVTEVRIVGTDVVVVDCDIKHEITEETRAGAIAAVLLSSSSTGYHSETLVAEGCNLERTQLPGIDDPLARAPLICRDQLLAVEQAKTASERVALQAKLSTACRVYMDAQR